MRNAYMPDTPQLVLTKIINNCYITLEFYKMEKNINKMKKIILKNTLILFFSFLNN